MTLATMGRDLRVRRRALGLTQAGLAEAVGTRPVMVGRWERGEALPSVDEVLRLAEVLDLDPAVAAEWSAVARRPSPEPALVLSGTAVPPPGDAGRAPRRGPGRPQWLARLSSVVAARRLRGSVLGEDGENAVFPAPRLRSPGGSYLDDPAEQRRYAWRAALTLVVLGALAIGLVWALGELRQGWDAFLDLFRGNPPGGGLTRALALWLPW